MPKSTLLLQMIDLLRERPGITITQMSADLGRSERTIYRYLESLSDELHVPVYCERGGYSIATRAVPGQLTLTPKEILTVRLALTTGPLRRGGVFTEQAVSAWRKIESALTSDALESVQDAVARHSITMPVFSVEDLEPDTLRALVEAVGTNKRLAIVYRSMRSGETRNLTIDPYALVFRRHNWYMIGFSHAHNRAVQLKLVRVVRAEATGQSFQMPQDFSVDQFYAKGWEMWTGSEEQLIRVKFDTTAAPLIRESKRHATQELEELPDGGVIFSVRVSGIEEIGFWLLSWGSHAEVLYPPELRNALRETAEKVAGMYGGEAKAPVEYLMAAESRESYGEDD